MSGNQEKAVLRLTQPDGSIQEVTLEQLALSNNVTYQALVTLLLKKGIIEADELLAEVNRIHKGRIEGE